MPTQAENQPDEGQAPSQTTETPEPQAPEGEQPVDVASEVPEKFHVRDEAGELDVQATLLKQAKSYREMERFASARESSLKALESILAEREQPKPPPTTGQSPEDWLIGELAKVRSDTSLDDTAKQVRQAKLWKEYARKDDASEAQPAGPSQTEMGRRELQRAQLASNIPFYAAYKQDIDRVIQHGEQTGYFGAGATESDKVVGAALWYEKYLASQANQAGNVAGNIEQQIRDGLKSAGVTSPVGGRRSPTPTTKKTPEEEEVERIKAEIRSHKFVPY